LHDGQVAAHSAGLNEGSEFIVSLPLAAAATESPESPAEAPAPPASASSKRVIIVDDNQDSAEAIAALLASSGFVVHTSYDGELALEQSRGFKPQAAVLDIGLPGMDGFELARRLRADNPAILLIALSGWRQDPASSEEQVFDHYLTKPIEISAIENLLLRNS
jgi:CheY-like chemotaxis protein